MYQPSIADSVVGAIQCAMNRWRHRDEVVPKEHQNIEVYCFDAQDGMDSGMFVPIGKIPWWGNKSARLSIILLEEEVVTREKFGELQKELGCRSKVVEFLYKKMQRIDSVP